MNNKCDGDESTACATDVECLGIGNELCGHGGHHDWRLPTILELKGLLLEPSSAGSCSTSPCVDPDLPGDTALSNYWSSTPQQNNSNNAWIVFFPTGQVNDGTKFTDRHVRAVRGGLSR